MKKLFLILIPILLSGWLNTLSARVILQAFYWDVPAGGVWWDTLSAKTQEWAELGIDALWLPPAHKSQGGAQSMGYTPYDYFDLGSYKQLGSLETRFGSESELRRLIGQAHKSGLKVYADIVINHNSGGSLEYNPWSAQNTWTKFLPASGKFPRNAKHFHPNSLASGDEGSATGFEQTDLCHREPEVQQWLWQSPHSLARWMKESLGFDGWRFDYAHGYGPWVVKSWLAAAGGFGWADHWSGDKWILNKWVEDTGGRASVLDYPLYYAMDNAFDGNNLQNLQKAGLISIRPENAVTFVASHDSDEIWNKMQAYAFILTHEGTPCIYYPDLESGDKDKLAALIDIHNTRAKGSTTVLFAGVDEYIAQRNGKPGLLVYFNQSAQWKSRQVQSKFRSVSLQELTGTGHKVQADSQGRVLLKAPPRSYTIYSL